MILLYTFVLVSLGLARFLINRRVARLEKKYVQTAQAVDELAREPQAKDAKRDPCLVARQHYELGQLVLKRDRLEAKHERAARFADKFGRGVAVIRNWNGKKLPYTFGALDVSGALYLVDRYGLNDTLSVTALVEQVKTLLGH